MDDYLYSLIKRIRSAKPNEENEFNLDEICNVIQEVIYEIDYINTRLDNHINE